MVYQSWYRFGNGVFRLDSTMPIRACGDLGLFQIAREPEQYQICVDFAPEGMDLPDDIGRARIDRNGQKIRIYLDRSMHPEPSDQHIFDLIPVPLLLLEQGILILHASCILYGGEMILFSGPSGVGKSTQASLWKRELGVEIINGDRALVFQRDGGLYAGSHFQSGTSGICKNVVAPLRALILLGQGREDRIYHPGGAELFRRLSSQVIGYPNRRPLADIASALIAKVASDVTVCCYDCTMDKNAVTYLKRYLYEK